MTQTENQFELPVATGQSSVVVNSAQAVRHFVPPARVGSFGHFNGSSMSVVVLNVRNILSLTYTESRAA